MSDSFIEPDILNTGLISIDAYVDDSGNNKLINGQLSSSNFDGLIPLESTTLPVSDIQIGMSFLPLGDTEGTFRTVYQIDFDDPEITDNPSDEYILYYIGDNNEIQTVTYDKNDLLEVSYENIDDIFLGSRGWTITQAGNAIFSNIFARGRIEATEGFLENLGITGILTVEPGGIIAIGSQITIDELGISATNTSGSTTFFLDAETGDVEIFGYASEAATASALGILEDEIDALYDEGFLTDEDLSDTGSTIISGNRIRTGVIDANLVNVSSGLTGLRGLKLNSLGLFAYNSSGQQTFRINSQTGEITISGYATDADLENLDYLTEEDIFITGTTNISGNRIRTGVLEGLVYRSNASITRTSGDGVYFDDGGYLRVARGSSVLSFNGLTGALTIEGYATDGELSSGLDGKIDDGGAATDVNNNVTNISGGKIRTGVIESNSYSGVTDGTNFSSNGLAINLTTGALTAEAFRIDANGNAAFKGNLQALSGYFGDATYGITIGNNGSQVGLETTTLKLGSQIVDGVKHGSIAFYTTSGTSLGNVASIDSNKNWVLTGFGIGVGFGTNEDYFLLPGTGNSSKPRFRGNGFEWYNQSGTRYLSISAGTGVQLFSGTFIGNLSGTSTNTNNLDSTVSGGARITGGGVKVTNVGASSSSDLLRRDSSEQLKVTSSSTRRVKTNISPLEDMTVLDLDVVKFKYIDGYLDQNDQRIDDVIPGFIAEQVYEKIPIAVDLDENGAPKNWNDRIIVPIMVKTIQDQQRQINLLIEKIEKLEKILG